VTALIVAPHCDDAELGASMVAKGARLAVISANDPDRWAEQERAAGWLGVDDLMRAGFPDGEIRHDHHLVAFIELALMGRDIDIVYSPPIADTHQDHAAVAAAVVSAVRRSPVELVEYETPSTMPTWVPNLWVPMTSTDLDEQALALSEHISQRDRPYFSPHWLGNRAMFRGQQVGIPFAQAYRIVRAVTTTGGLL
jgi:LmbE family N-acetylglucosaminyl deacetylase